MEFGVRNIYVIVATHFDYDNSNLLFYRNKLLFRGIKMYSTCEDGKFINF